MNRFLLPLIFMCSTFVIAEDFKVDASKCFANGWDKSRFLALREAEFDASQSDINLLIEQLQHCLANTNPEVRDGVAYEAYFTWLRANKVSKEQLTSIFNRFTNTLDEKVTLDSGVYLPFVALVYSEIVRVDRVDSYLNEQQRQKAVDTIGNYLATITDYRGFDENVGWRHGVAHASDVILQLALNQEINAAQIKALAASLSKQTNPTTIHFYSYGEPERLARASAYLMLRTQVDIEFWEAWLAALVAPAPFENWGAVFKSQAGLAKRNNVRQFLTNLYAMISSSENERLVKLTQKVRELIRATG